MLFRSQSASGTTSKLAVGTSGYILKTQGSNNPPAWVAQNTITAGNIDAGATGDLLYQSGAGTTSKLNIGTAGQVLVVNAGATAPSWTSQESITAGNLKLGANNVQGSILYQSGASATTGLAPGTTNYLLQTNGGSANPSWVNPATLTVKNIEIGRAHV